MTIYIDNETKLRVNIDAPYKGFSRLDTPAIRAAAGVVETPAPTPPQDTIDHPDHYYVTEQDSAPYLVWTKKSDEQIEQIELAKIPTISPRQIRQALTAAGLRTQVETAVATGDQDLKDWWEYATSFERSHPQVVAMAEGLGVAPEALDQLFIGAAQL